MSNSFDQLEMQVLRWGEERGIIANSTAMAQAIKTLEEVQELLSALHRNNKQEAIDAYADILVTLILGADILGTDMLSCLNVGYNTIKDRTGYLRADGVFIKDS